MANALLDGIDCNQHMFTVRHGCSWHAVLRPQMWPMLCWMAWTASYWAQRCCRERTFRAGQRPQGWPSKVSGCAWRIVPVNDWYVWCSAEATDVANAVLDGVDGILLGAETLRGKYAVQTVQTILAICHQAEKAFDHNYHFEHLMQASAPCRR